MEINKKSRAELKAYFVKNALPTESNFRDLIDAGLNQKDDGLVKSADQPVQIAASTAGDKPAIHLYESFATDTKPAWVLSLQADGKKGFGIGDGDGKKRLFIEGATGDIGINGALTITGGATITGVMSGVPNDYAKAQYTLSGGGTVTWGGRGQKLKWTKRFIAMCAEQGETFSDGHVAISASSASPSIVQDWDDAVRACDADGVVLNDWEALYAVHRPGGDSAAVTFRIVNYGHKFKAPSNWILVATVNGEDNTVKLGTGEILAAKSAIFKGALVPTGTIVMWSGAAATIPDGWAICDGANGTPDLRDRFIVGAGNAYSLGAKGGEATHVLTIDEMPSHHHTALAGMGKDDQNFGGNTASSGERVPFAMSDTPNAYEEKTRATGGSKAHENRPPYHALFYIMKL
ncbi:hypothetical protein BE20_31510 [Sorangium cellulosum]|uniref:Phage tail collar domain-containing protein n=1 Tax=Sorangium cellulosum TaxID=56 RepID=A0A150RYR9_SORCE|nr:hypothetical protein BE18_52115 [Sorangium cellulosum]KYF99403.1 hypothetical protein BE20_31510 [Sorangium cellulosum]